MLPVLHRMSSQTIAEKIWELFFNISKISEMEEKRYLEEDVSGISRHRRRMIYDRRLCNQSESMRGRI